MLTVDNGDTFQADSATGRRPRSRARRVILHRGASSGYQTRPSRCDCWRARSCFDPGERRYRPGPSLQSKIWTTWQAPTGSLGRFPRPTAIELAVRCRGPASVRPHTQVCVTRPLCRFLHTDFLAALRRYGAIGVCSLSVRYRRGLPRIVRGDRSLSPSASRVVPDGPRAVPADGSSRYPGFSLWHTVVRRSSADSWPG